MINSANIPSDNPLIGFQSIYIFDNIINTLYNYIGKSNPREEIDKLSGLFSCWACKQCYKNMISKNYYLYIDSCLPYSYTTTNTNKSSLLSLQQICASNIDSHIIIRLIQKSNIDFNKLIIKD